MKLGRVCIVTGAAKMTTKDELSTKMQWKICQAKWISCIEMRCALESLRPIDTFDEICARVRLIVRG